MGTCTVLDVLVMGIMAFLEIMLIGFVYYVFPKKCDKCGKLTSYDSVVSDTIKYYNAGWWKITDRKFSRKRCLSCGYEGEKILLHKSERSERG
jgi:hypothetical protein